MELRLSEMRYREVIDMADGARLGYATSKKAETAGLGF